MLSPTDSFVKRTSRAVLTSRAFAPLCDLFTRNVATILMMHRFADPDLQVRGHNPALLAANLEYLRRYRFNICSLPELITRLESGAEPLPRTVVFTVDDGYSDFARVAAPVFERFDCPVTVFLVTGLVDGGRWIWHDAIPYLCSDAPSGSISIGKGPDTISLAWSSDEERDVAISDTIRRLMPLPRPVIASLIADLARATNRELPDVPPPGYAGLSWDDARALESKGCTFGVHTHTHPMMSRETATHARREIELSWTRLRAELTAPTPVICYPYGMPGDFGEREKNDARAAGLRAGIMASGGSCTLKAFVSDRFAVPRYAYLEEHTAFRKTVGGLERLTQFVRGGMRF